MENKKFIIVVLVSVLIIIGFLILEIYDNKREIDYLNNKYDDMFDDINNIRVRLNQVMNETSFSEYFDRCYDGREYVC